MGEFYPSRSTPGHAGDYKAWMAAGVAHTHSPLALRRMTKAGPQLPVPYALTLLLIFMFPVLPPSLPSRSPLRKENHA